MTRNAFFSTSERGAGFNKRCKSFLERSEKIVAASVMDSTFDSDFFETVA